MMAVFQYLTIVIVSLGFITGAFASVVANREKRGIWPWTWFSSPDTEDPEILCCPSDVFVCGPGPVNWTAPQSTDNCGIPTLTSTHNPGDEFEFPTTVTYTSIDEAGNTATCSFEVIVPPVLPDCDFAVDLCGWVQSPEDDFDWTRLSGETGSLDTGPSADHTSSDGTGHYVFIEDSGHTSGEKAHLKLGTYHDVPGVTNCFSFYYHMYGDDIATFSIYVNKEEEELGTPAFTRSGNKGDNWFYGQFSITRPDTDPFVITVEGVKGDDIEGDIAIDDVKILPGSCEPDDEDPKISCCPSDLHVKGPGPVSWTAPEATDNRGTPALISTHEPGDEFEFPTAVTYTATDDAGNTATCSFDVIVPPGVPDCDFEVDLCGWVQSPEDDFDWTRLSGETGSIDTGPSADHTSSDGTGFYAYIETSDHTDGEKAHLTFTTYEDVPGETNCFSFYYHMYGDDIETLSIYVNKEAEELGAPAFNRSGDQGEHWKYGQFDITRPDADQYVITVEGVQGAGETGDLAIDDVMVRPGTCQPDNEEPKLSCCPSDLYVKGPGPVSWTAPEATDNRGTPALTSTHEPGEVFEFPTTVTYTATDDAGNNATCSFEVIVPPHLIDCNFDDDFCEWSQSTDDNFDWTRYSGSTLSPRTGPTADHTSTDGTGSYVYIESSDQDDGETAQLTITTYHAEPAEAKCFTFYYHMWGTHIETLNIYVTSDSETLGTPVFTVTGNQGKNWNYGQFNVTRPDSDLFVITVEGVQGSGFRGDIAIDDIKYLAGACIPIA